MLTLVIGGLYNWKDQEERLVYKGLEGNWHQFTKVGEPDVIWCEVLQSDLRLLEETPCEHCKGIGRTPTDLWSDISAMWQPCQLCDNEGRKAFYNAKSEEQLDWFQSKKTTT